MTTRTAKGNSVATWIAIAVTFALGVFGTGSTWYFRSQDKSAATSDEHVGVLIDGKLNPVVSTINTNITQKLAPITSDISDLKTGIAEIKGQIKQLNLDLSRSTKLQLNKLNLQIKDAESAGIKADPGTLTRLGEDLLDVAYSDKSNHNLAWEVLNRTLHYRSTAVPISLANRVVLAAQDRNIECMSVAPNAELWIFEGIAFAHCTQHLDQLVGPQAVKNGLVFDNVVFKDVRIIYSGGPLKLDKVYFLNCTFELEPGDKSKILATTLLASNVVSLHLP